MSGENILCIEGKHFQLGDKIIGLKREFFESSIWKNSVYVESPAFIESYEVEYWFVVDSIKFYSDTLADSAPYNSDNNLRGLKK